MAKVAAARFPKVLRTQEDFAQGRYAEALLYHIMIYCYNIIHDIL